MQEHRSAMDAVVTLGLALFNPGFIGRCSAAAAHR
jgi:hypothetical protein